ncbi:MAG: GPR endopeptidase [Bacilli bacterium]|nr:GPR endopeptidase [Bacilli bacterium]
MAHEINLDDYKIRTDLLIETIENAKELDIKIEDNQRTEDDITITIVDITKKHESIINRKAGRYITIEFADVTDFNNQEKVLKIFADELGSFLEYLNIPTDYTCLVIGLGNDKSTPDSLGPAVINDILVTKHLFTLGEAVQPGFRNVSALTPGVMGTTGIETSKIITGVAREVQPDFLLIIDALASQSITRVNRTIQMTDTGVNPGSGVGNNRLELSQELLGIPVIAVGVPTVVDAVTIVSETINFITNYVSYQKENLESGTEKMITPDVIVNDDQKNNMDAQDQNKLMGLLGNLSEEERKRLIYEVLSPLGYNLMVTPKEIDFLILKLSLVLAEGINKALHKQV